MKLELTYHIQYPFAERRGDGYIEACFCSVLLTAMAASLFFGVMKT